MSVLGALLLASCRSVEKVMPVSFRHLSPTYKGIARLKTYDFAHPDIPPAFDGCRIAFISDLHYKSLLRGKGLQSLVRLLNHHTPDALLIGGDFHEGCEYVTPLLEALSQISPPLGTYAVLGNNDYGACYPALAEGMEKYGIHLLEHRTDTLWRGDSRILVSGVRNPFDLNQNGVSPTLALSPDDFVLLLSHTPDYAEDVSVENADLVLAGHTHGGQVTLFGLYAPMLPSKYGQRFRTGVKRNSQGIPVLVTNGIGTSRIRLRLFAPSEVVMIVLRSVAPE